MQLKKRGAEDLREFYFVPREAFPLDYEISIYDDKVVVVSYLEATVMSIRSKNFAESQRKIFMMAFSYAKMTENDLLLDEHRAYLSRTSP